MKRAVLRRVRPPVVLCIAGFDPSSGAGITADVKTAAGFGCYAITCISALTVQSTEGVRRVQPVSAQVITETLNELARDFKIAAVKIGMLGSEEVVRTVARWLKRNRLSNVVLDPVLESSSGARLLSKAGVGALREELIPLANVVTPNIREAEVLGDAKIGNVNEAKRAAIVLQENGAQAVVVTGGHLDPAVDVVLGAAGRMTLLKGGKVRSSSTHGTGCAFSTALACNLAMGRSLEASAAVAKDFVRHRLMIGLRVGKGAGPVI